AVWFEALRRAARDRIHRLCVIFRVKPAAPIPRREDRRRRIAVEDELHELFAIERGEKGEPSPAPSAAYAFVSLRRNDAQDPERLQIMCERRRLASIESDELHRIFPHREFSPRVSWVLRLDARQSAARKSASR